MFTLKPTDQIVTAWCEYHRGPGWSNALVHIIVRNGDGKLREEHLQRDEHPPALREFFESAAAMNAAVVGVVADHVRRPAARAERRPRNEREAEG